MAKNKIQRIDQEIAKVREKIAEYQDKLKTLEAQKTEAENLEIVQMVRALLLPPDKRERSIFTAENGIRRTAFRFA